MPGMGRRTRSRAWSDGKEQAWDSAATSICPQQSREAVHKLHQRTPGGQASMKRNRRELNVEEVDALIHQFREVQEKFEQAAAQKAQEPAIEQASRASPADAAVARDRYLSPSSALPDDEESNVAQQARSTPTYDVVASENGALELLPAQRPEAKPRAPGRRSLDDLRQDEAVAIRVFRFVEDKEDLNKSWEKELRNVNSGSLLWLLVHMLPKMHSMGGAKYGSWFTAHTVRVKPKHFSSGYHMCNEGYAGQAKTFGTSSATKSLVTMEKLRTGYFWFVSPTEATADLDVASGEHLETKGWQHVGVSGALSGEDFVAEWRRQGSPMDEESLQEIVNRMLAASAKL